MDMYAKVTEVGVFEDETLTAIQVQIVIPAAGVAALKRYAPSAADIGLYVQWITQTLINEQIEHAPEGKFVSKLDERCSTCGGPHLRCECCTTAERKTP